jgi:hypothetical protein
MSSYDLANERITDDLRNNMDTTDANNYAKNMMKSSEQDLNIKELQPQQAQQVQQYTPPVPPQSQSQVPQQSQHMIANQTPSIQQFDGSYSGFDSTDKLSSLDTAFNTKMHVEQLTNANSSARKNDILNVEAYIPESNIDKFSAF